MQNQINENRNPFRRPAAKKPGIPDNYDPDCKITADFLSNPASDADSDIFLNSLETLRPDDIAPPPEKKKRSAYDIVYTLIRYTILTVSLCVFAWSMYTILQSLIGYRQAEDLYASLADDFNSDDYSMHLYEGSQSASMLRPSPTMPDFASSLVLSDSALAAQQEFEIVQYNEELEKMKSKLNAISIKNPDVYGWIKIDNTVIDYPIMQSDDNEYYLDHAYTGDYLTAGAIFADFRNYESLLKNFHVILYGHNMRNGLMFNNVMNYLDKKFFDENPYITIYTFDGIYTFEVFAIYETRYDYDYIRTAFPNYDEFIAYCEKLRANSIHVREGVEFKTGDRMLTLSTCTNNVTETGRYALHAKLVKTEK